MVHVVTRERDNIVSDTIRPMKVDGADIFIRFDDAIEIIKKVKSKVGEFLDSWVSPRRPFGIDSSFSKSEEFSNVKDEQHCIECVGKGLQLGYISREYVESHIEWIDRWKVFMPRANNIGTELNDDNLNTFVGKPGMVCTEAYIAIGAEKNLNEEECKNISSYMRTKFVRFMHSLAKASQDATSKTFVFVPVVDFNKNWSDKDLYTYFELSESEIIFIEKMIKTME